MVTTEATLIALACLLTATTTTTSAFVWTINQQATTTHRSSHVVLPSPLVSPFGAHRHGHGRLKQQLKLKQAINPDSVFTDTDWHPHDPAHTTARLLQGIWDQIANANTMVRGETSTVIYPEMKEKLNESPPRFLNLIMAHLDACKDVCDNFGITTTIVPFQDPKTRKITGFTVKSFKKPDSTKDAEDEYEFAYDPFWDDGTDFDSLYQGVDDEDMSKTAESSYPEIVNKVPAEDETIVDITKKWVSKLMSDMGVCPFTSGSDLAGLPMGNVFYIVDRCSTFEEMYAAYWAEVVRIECKDEKEISTTLLICPEFCMDHIEVFESFTNTLTQPLSALEIEDLIQLVFFHPQWSFRDGDARASAAGQAANYARRSPWPMINILRTNQVRAAQKGIPTGLVYKQNEKTLASIGVQQLETMLRLRDWTDIADVQVNRREMDALKIAQDFQATGAVRQEDQSVAHDATPAANRVERSQVDQGDLVNVVLQAMEKRLGKQRQQKQGDESSSSAAAAAGVVTPLSGPETSATSMATDFLLERLQEIATGGGGGAETEEEQQKQPANVAVAEPPKKEKAEKTKEKDGKKKKAEVKSKSVAEDDKKEKTKDEKEKTKDKTTKAVDADAEQENEKEYQETDELKKAKAARMEEARKAIFDDMRDEEKRSAGPSSTGRSKDPMTDVLFGGDGISKALADEDELFQEGMNPDSFY